MAIFFASCAQSTNNSANSSSFNNGAVMSSTITANDYQVAIQKGGVQILDVRTAGEYKTGHIQNALQANWSDPKEFQDRTQHLDKKTPVYIYCQAGGRSAAAQSFLVEKGYTVINLEGGMSNWKMKGLPVEGGTTAPEMRTADFDHVINSNKLVLVDVGATWCPPCRKMLPVVEKIKNNQGAKLYFLAVDGGNDIEVMKHINAASLPTFVVYKNGKEVWRKQGIVEDSEFAKVLAN
jgi:rhodanese-related sulfurtransferase